MHFALEKSGAFVLLKKSGKNLRNIRKYGIVYTTQERYLMLHPTGLAGCGLYIFRTPGIRPGILSLFVWKAPSALITALLLYSNSGILNIYTQRKEKK